MQKEATLRQIEGLSHDHPIIFFDGICGLCDRLVSFLIRRDKKMIFRYAALQDFSGQLVSTHLGLAGQVSTVIGLYQGRYYTKSDVLILISERLGGKWKMIGLVRFVPAMLRNGVYHLVVKYRYQIFGKKTECSIISNEIMLISSIH